MAKDTSFQLQSCSYSAAFAAALEQFWTNVVNVSGVRDIVATARGGVSWTAHAVVRSGLFGCHATDWEQRRPRTSFYSTATTEQQPAATGKQEPDASVSIAARWLLARTSGAVLGAAAAAAATVEPSL